MGTGVSFLSVLHHVRGEALHLDVSCHATPHGDRLALVAVKSGGARLEFIDRASDSMTLAKMALRSIESCCCVERTPDRLVSCISRGHSVSENALTVARRWYTFNDRAFACHLTILATHSCAVACTARDLVDLVVGAFSGCCQINRADRPAFVGRIS